MNKVFKFSVVILLLLVACFVLTNSFYTNNINSNENTLVISVCTGDMRALETGVSTYAGYKQVPIMLSDKSIPNQLKTWLPNYIAKNNITKIIWVGPIKTSEAISLKLMGVDFEQINGNSISEILVTMAENTHDKNNDTVIFTASDPMAGLLGAYMKTPVFITANNSSYTSADTLDDNYKKYLKNHNITNIIIVGYLPDTIINELKQYNVTLEILSGDTSAKVSMAVNNKLKQMGYIDSNTVYYGFYGELPAIIPTVVKNNAYLIEDSSFDTSTINYMKNNSIDTIYLTRNMEYNYIQMEETDYISSNTVNTLINNNFNIEFLTNERTLDEATGLYDMKIIVLDSKNNITNKEVNPIKNSKPPLLSILDKNQWVDSNNLSVNITKNNNSSFDIKWSTIHPYEWIKYNESYYFASSKTGYDYYWIYNNLTWTVKYNYNNTTYYEVKWIENNDNTWTEKHLNYNYTWKYDGSTWYCYNSNSELCYYLNSI